MVVFFAWMVGILFAIQLAVLIQLILWKSSQLRKQENIAAEIARVAPELNTFIYEEKEEIPKLRLSGKKQAAAAETLLDDLASQSKDIVRLPGFQQFAAAYLAAPYKKTLRRGSWAERINTLYYVDDFYMETMKEDVYTHLLKRKKQDEEYRQCLRNCVTFGDVRVLSYLFREPQQPFVFLKALLLRMNGDMMEGVAMKLDPSKSGQENLLFAFITVNGELRNFAYFPFVERMLQDPREEVRIKAMKSLCNYGTFTAFSMLEQFAESSSWQERMYSAKLIGACGLDDFRNTLISLITDPVWWVRFAAAENLAKLQNGEKILHGIYEDSEDAYARDIAAHMLVRKGAEAVQ